MLSVHYNHPSNETFCNVTPSILVEVNDISEKRIATILEVENEAK
jgi:hypothetical protein